MISSFFQIILTAGKSKKLIQFWNPSGVQNIRGNLLLAFKERLRRINKQETVLKCNPRSGYINDSNDAFDFNMNRGAVPSIS